MTVTNNAVAPKGQEAVEVLRKMLTLIKQSKIEQASAFLSDDVQWRTPFGSFDGKKDWLNNFKEPNGKQPVFEEPEIVENDRDNVVLTRKGKKKVGFLNVKILETVDYNDDNKICKLTVSRA